MYIYSIYCYAKTHHLRAERLRLGVYSAFEVRVDWTPATSRLNSCNFFIIFNKLN